MEFSEFKTQFNIKLNEQQEDAIQNTDGASLLLAVPGSGKTTTLVARLGYMVYCKDIAPESILTMTYTVPAAAEMKTRFKKVFGDEYADRLEFRTINGICAIIILKYTKYTGGTSFKLLENNAKILTEIYIKKCSSYPAESDIKELQLLITNAKNLQYTKEEQLKALDTAELPFYELYTEYIEVMKQKHLMDYDDQMVYAYNILRRYSDILQYFQNRFRYICVDEAQDTSKIQHAIIRLLASKTNNIFMVGDEDQSIYGFRAAYPDALLSFEDDYTNAKIKLLETNYRSTQEIVAAADKFIANNNARHEKHMKAVNSAGSKLEYLCVKDRLAQYAKLIEIVSPCKCQTAFLYRNNDSAIPLIDRLDRSNIGYKCRQVESTFFSHYVIKDVLDILSFAKDPSNIEAFMRIYYRLNTGINKYEAMSAVECAKKYRNCSLLGAVEMVSSKKPKLQLVEAELSMLWKCEPVIAIQRIKTSLGYGKYLQSKSEDACNKLDVLGLLAAGEKTIDGFIKRLDDLKKIVARGTTDENSNIFLSTVHSSKGLEYDRVVFLDVVDGLLPAVECDKLGNAVDIEEQKELEEERRLFYVGITRAKKELLLLKYNDETSIFLNILQNPEYFAKAKEALEKRKCAYETSLAGFALKQRVLHLYFGEGEIVEIRNDGLSIIEFENGNKKMFDLDACSKKGLVKAL